MIDVLKVQELQLPTIAVRGITVLPNNEIRLEIGRAASVRALTESEKQDNYVLLINQKDPMVDVPKVEDFQKYGVVAKISMKLRLPNGNYKVKFKTLIRADITEFVQNEPFFVTKATTLPSTVTETEKEIALVRMLVNNVIENSEMIFSNSKEVISKIQGSNTAERITDIIAFYIKLPENDKIKYLETIDITKRLEYLLVDIEKTKEISKLEQKINAEVKKSIDENQKEYFLREKMRVIQNELGDKANKETEANAIRKKIKQAKMPKSTEKKALDELKRFESLPQNASESGVIRTYLEWLVNIPWSKKSKERIDIKYAEKILNEEHYGLEKVKDRILEYLAVKQMTGKTPPTILCLVGPPGTGKTSLARSVANALNREFVKVSLGGVKDESEIRGHRRTYLGALPGRIIQAMKKAGVNNPVFLLDELDKMSSDYKGDPSSAMLEVLDPEQNKQFSDHYLEEPYDLSRVLFIGTANYLGNIPEPLRDRMEIVELSSYTELEKFKIAKNHLIPRQLEHHGLDENKLEITDNTLTKVIQLYTREAGVRNLERQIGALCRKSTKKILAEGIDKIKIDSDDVEKYLGKQKFRHNIAEVENQVGVVTGLAYTPYGGDTLPVEVTFYKGTGKLVLTGKLGDVMKESAQAALSYVKANADKFKIDSKLFKENDIHVHVPEGAIPKDGPSAGVTMATSLISALANKKVRKDVGMTGEITLRGRVLPIGGLKEKSIAAHRSGLKKIIFPKDNVKDLEDVPETVLDEIEFIPVYTIDEVLGHALV